jgi:hypothetical protein
MSAVAFGGSILSRVVASAFRDSSLTTAHEQYTSPRTKAKDAMRCRNRRRLISLLLICAVSLTDATTLETQLAASYTCYDPTGTSCSCSGQIDLASSSLTGTIPSELSACTALITL